ncbi:DUF2157 domain-containing protein [Pseudonocardia sp. GCM10023141]|uniref:DUF2157 domain-containing protein n=1 Tax=Pseudonocardia sp. GCM10023141 TaxID=3252653 RepID=UPI0036175092
MTMQPTDLDTSLERWVARGLISGEQADRIRADERHQDPDRRAGTGSGATPLVTEALGYVGGVLVLVAAVTLTGRFWTDLGIGGRVLVAFVAAGILFGAGLAVPSRLGGAGGRLRSVSWLLSVALLGGAVALVGNDVIDVPGDAVALLASGVAAVYAGVLWRAHRWLLQQVALVATLAVAAGSAAALLPRDDEQIVGLAVWGVGTVWLLLGWGRVVAARHVAYVCGGIVVIAGSMLTVQHDWGCALAIVSAVALVAAGVALRDLVLLGVGAVATLIAVPVVLYRFFPDTLVAPFALLAVGALLVVGALYTARRRNRSPSAAGRDRAPVPPRVAAGAAAAVAIVTAVVVLAMGI